MPSSRELVLVLLAACGTDRAPQDPPDDEQRCETSFVDYDTFGRPFLLDWCTGCHSAGLPPLMRQGSPSDVNFDDHAAVLQWRERIRVRAVRENDQPPTMPPAGGPTEEERQLLTEWLDCGLR